MWMTATCAYLEAAILTVPLLSTAKAEVMLTVRPFARITSHSGTMASAGSAT